MIGRMVFVISPCAFDPKDSVHGPYENIYQAMLLNQLKSIDYFAPIMVEHFAIQWMISTILDVCLRLIYLQQASYAWLKLLSVLILLACYQIYHGCGMSDTPPI